MTGIEKLRKLASMWTYDGRVMIEQKKLSDIADQIERETEEESGRLYDMRLAEETDVCEAFGIESVDDPLASLRRHVEGLNDTIENLRLELCEARRGDARDPAADVSMSAYDLLPPDEREAIAWVRDHGGLDAVRAQMINLRVAIGETCARAGVEHTGETVRDAQAIWRKLDWYKARLGESVQRVAYERHLARRQRQIDESHAALRRRNKLIAELEAKVRVRERANDELNEELNAMRPRLIPEGMEWPRYEDGEPVRIRDDFACWCGEVHEVASVTLRDGRSIINESQPHSFVVSDGPFTAHGKRVKRPAPKVLDADGAEIRKGDTVYFVDGTHPIEVINIYPEQDSCPVKIKKSYDGATCYSCTDPQKLTHRAPVLSADGLPLREGETVYRTNSTTAFVVDDIMAREDGADVVRLKGGAWHLPQDLTHERPEIDSWEKWREDFVKIACDYFNPKAPTGYKCKTCPIHDKRKLASECIQLKGDDLERRAKELAGGA